MMMCSKKKLAGLVAASIMVMTPFAAYAETLQKDTEVESKTVTHKDELVGNGHNYTVTGGSQTSMIVSSGASANGINVLSVTNDGGLMNKGNISANEISVTGFLDNRQGGSITAIKVLNASQFTNAYTATASFESGTFDKLTDRGTITANTVTINNNGIFYYNSQSTEINTIKLGNGAKLNLQTGGVSLNDIVTGEGAVININTDVTHKNPKPGTGWTDGTINIDSITGNGTNIIVDNIEKTDVKITENKDTNLSITGTKEVTNNFDENNLLGSLQDLADTVEIKNGEQVDNVIAEEGKIFGQITAQVDDEGNVIAGSVIEDGNIANEGITELANVALMAWRAENDEMHQRMGELRSSKGEAGIWARMKRGESESGDMNIKNQYSTYQLGYDEKVGDSNWYLGGAISRTEGKSSFATGSGENQSTGFTVYGTYVADNGEYVDLSAKYARLDNEFDVFGRSGIESTGDYRNNGYAFSAEYGKRIETGNDFWIEPQVQLTYGHLSSANYTTSRGVKAAQDAMDSVVGRVGFAAGKDISAGNVYVKASYLYDFDGETAVSMTDGKNSAVYEQDLGGGWFEFGIGTNINLSETSHLYFDVERAVGGDIDTPWQWNAGVRFDF